MRAAAGATATLQQLMQQHLEQLQHGDGSLLQLVAAALAAVLVLGWAASKVSFALRCRQLRGTVPAVPGGLPILGHAISLVRTPPWDLLTSWVFKHGPMYRFTMFGTQVVVCAEPQYLLQIMNTRLRSFHKDLVLAYSPFMPLLGGGIVTSDGDKWFHQRRQFSHMLRVDVLKSIPRLAIEAVDRLGAKLDAVAASGGTIDIGEEFRHLTLQVISEVLLSIGPEESDRVFAQLYLPIVVECHKRVWNPARAWFVAAPAWWRFQRNIRSLNAYISGHICERWAQRQKEAAGAAAAPPTSGAPSSTTPQAVRRGDVLDRLLDGVQDEVGLGGGVPSAALTQVRDELKTLVLAGHETSASMLNWAVVELLQPENATLLQRARTEADAAWSAANPPAAAAAATALQAPDGAALGYAEGCLREALRKYSIVPIVSRLCSADTELTGPAGEVVSVPRGAVVMALLQGIHYRTDIWPEPAVYRPERFCGEDGRGEGRAPIAAYTFLPFIEGPRSCLGQNLSLLESKVVLSLLLRRYEFALALPDGQDARRKHKWLIPVIPHHPTLVTVARRSG